MVIKAALLIQISRRYSWPAVSNTIPKILRVVEGEKVQLIVESLASGT